MIIFMHTIFFRLLIFYEKLKHFFWNELHTLQFSNKERLETMNIDKEFQDLADDAISALCKKIVRLREERDSAVAKANDRMVAFVEKVDEYCAQIYRLKNEISNLHTRINTLEHLLELARSKND
jgi:hypothetical protein